VEKKSSNFCYLAIGEQQLFSIPFHSPYTLPMEFGIDSPIKKAGRKGKTQVKYIENTKRRQNCYYKRKNGVIKKVGIKRISTRILMVISDI